MAYQHTIDSSRLTFFLSLPSPTQMSELDTLAALMNAEFAEAESFELVVE